VCIIHPFRLTATSHVRHTSCNVLQCVAVRCGVLQYVAAALSYSDPADAHPLRRVAMSHAVCCSVLQCAAVCCSVLQCVAVCCSVLQCAAMCCSVCCSARRTFSPTCGHESCSMLQCVAVCCSVSVLQCVLQCQTHILSDAWP